MPLAFDSLSHGKIAFGFFNIETDLLLLNRYFFFASEFCRCLIEAAELTREGEWASVLKGTLLEDEQVGNLMGAIHGFDFRGFIGEVYRLYPFPDEPEGFKQNPEGYQTRPILEQVLVKYGQTADILFRFRQENNEVAIGEYRFNQENFQELILYLWLGGYPRWRDGRRPGYMGEMKEAAVRAGSFPFERLEEKLI
jgi:hypothetical protein